MVGAIIMDVAYGIEVLSDEDPFIATATASFASVSQVSTPGAYLVDVLPILKYTPSWMPGAGFKRQAREWKKLTEAVYHAPFEEMKRTTVRILAQTGFRGLRHELNLQRRPAVAPSKVFARAVFN